VAGSLVISPLGSKLAFSVSTSAGVVALPAGNILISATGSPLAHSQSVWSADDRFFVFSAVSPTGPPNSFAKVYLEDFASNTTTLISVNVGGTGAANAASDWPCISSDGRWMVFRSWATDLVPGTINPPNLFLFDRLTGTKTLLTIESSPSPNWSSIVAKPSISADGGMVAFQSTKAMLVPGSLDLNRAPDLFATGQLLPPATDSVGDGISDAWRAQYFGGNGTTTNSQSCATCDADGDGVSNLQEYLAGTSPTDSGSVLRVQPSAAMSGNNVMLTWPAAPGKGYAVQYKLHLTDPVWQTPSGTPWVIGTTGYFNVTNTLAGGYFRIAAVN
jgi:Tol biopolymer transport system component